MAKLFLKKIDKYLLKEYIFPFIASVVTIVLLLSLDFIMKILDSVLSKGVDPSIILQYFFLNLAWILTLAVPMAVLLSSLMVFGKLSGENEITAMLSAGIHPYRIMLSPIIAALIITASMVYFQDQILPEANHKAAELGFDIKRAKPTAVIKENFMVTTIPTIKLLVHKVNHKEGTIEHVRIFKEDDNSVISAKTGRILINNSILFFLLNDGEIVQKKINKKGEYEVSRLHFTKHIQTIELPDDFKRTTRNYRSDREMNIEMMVDKVRLYKSKIVDEEDVYKEKIFAENPFIAIASDSTFYKSEKFNGTTKDVKKYLQQHINSNTKHINQHTSFRKSTASYLVEIHKKYSLSFACVIFILVGMPLGALSKKGGMGVAIASSFIIFILYWSFLTTGERMADRLVLPPVISMWMFNILLFGVGIFLMKKVIRQDVTISFDFILTFLKYITPNFFLKRFPKI